ncbi:hypothetical protein ACJX0J_028107 [Zea mays]
MTSNYTFSLFISFGAGGTTSHLNEAYFEDKRVSGMLQALAGISCFLFFNEIGGDPFSPSSRQTIAHFTLFSYLLLLYMLILFGVAHNMHIYLDRFFYKEFGEKSMRCILLGAHLQYYYLRLQLYLLSKYILSFIYERILHCIKEIIEVRSNMEALPICYCHKQEIIIILSKLLNILKELDDVI